MYTYIKISLSIHLSLDTLDWFHSLAIVNNAAMSIGVHISFLSYCFPFLQINTRSRIAMSCGSSIFNFLGKLHTVFHTDCTNLHPHKQCTGVPLSQHSSQQLLLVVLFDNNLSDRCELVSHYGFD